MSIKEVAKVTETKVGCEGKRGTLKWRLTTCLSARSATWLGVKDVDLQLLLLSIALHSTARDNTQTSGKMPPSTASYELDTTDLAYTSWGSGPGIFVGLPAGPRIAFFPIDFLRQSGVGDWRYIYAAVRRLVTPPTGLISRTDGSVVLESSQSEVESGDYLYTGMFANSFLHHMLT